jgi:transposase-like protein
MEMTCPKCDSAYIVDTLYATSNPKIVIQGYLCDECNHEWESVKQLKEW